MKTLFFIFFFVSSISFTYSQQISFVMDSIMDTYMKSGYADEHFMPAGKYKNKEREGEWKDYEVVYDFAYVELNNMPEQIFGYFLLYGEGNYKNGQREGLWKFYTIEDKTFKSYPQKEVLYRNGKLSGDYHYFYTDGKKGIDGKFINNAAHGEFLSYYKTGELYGRRDYINGKAEGIQEYFYKTGKLKFHQFTRNDTLEGPYEAFYESGAKQEIFTYKKGQIHGTYTYYYENGQLWAERLYENGINKEVISNYDSKGNKRDPGTLKNGNGTLLLYLENGKHYNTQYYENGKIIREEATDEFKR